MIKRTLYFGNPAYLSTREDQLIVQLPQVEKNANLPEVMKREAITKIPIEDIGVVILDHQQIVISQTVMVKLLANNAALITCDQQHLPTGLMLNLAGHTLQSARFKDQINASVSLMKQLWQQTIKAKIKNQAALLHSQGVEVENMKHWADKVLSGDADNKEGRAAAYYWKNLFRQIPGFKRERDGEPPNALLNYTYAILRAVVARSLVGAGILPTLGIHHRNQYNHYCLADDIMEPYRPFADALVLELIADGEDYTTLSTGIKKRLLTLPVVDVYIKGERSPLQIATQRTASSLAKCFAGKGKTILYPEINLKR